jgi:hypothetical protein
LSKKKLLRVQDASCWRQQADRIQSEPVLDSSLVTPGPIGNNNVNYVFGFAMLWMDVLYPARFLMMVYRNS